MKMRCNTMWITAAVAVGALSSACEEGNGDSSERSCCILGVLEVCRCAPRNAESAISGGNESICDVTLSTGLSEEDAVDAAAFCHYDEARACFAEMRSVCTRPVSGDTNCCKLSVLETCQCAPWEADEAVAGGNETTCRGVLEANIHWEDGSSPTAVCWNSDARDCYEQNATACN